MIPEDLMRKYKYGYVHSCEMLNEPFVKDLIKENRKLKDQQKEFVEWLENKIIEHKNLFFGEEEQNECLSITREAFKLALLNYKKIIGGKDEN